MVVSLDARPGARATEGSTLVQLADCGRAFLALPPGESALHAGESVQVTLPSLPPFVGTVRASSGVAEPPHALVIAPTGLPATACPDRKTATITPIDKAHS